MYLDKYIKEIQALCQKNKVKTLFVFGSALTEGFNEKSDIDLIVDFNTSDPLDYADNYFNLKFALQELFKRPIDLLESKAMKNPYISRNIDNSKFLIYGV